MAAIVTGRDALAEPRFHGVRSGISRKRCDIGGC
jgi:hypothetical protein